MPCKLGAQAEEKGRARHSAKGDSHNGELQGYVPKHEWACDKNAACRGPNH